jgi:hypothetical protein
MSAVPGLVYACTFTRRVLVEELHRESTATTVCHWSRVTNGLANVKRSDIVKAC